MLTLAGLWTALALLGLGAFVLAILGRWFGLEIESRVERLGVCLALGLAGGPALAAATVGLLGPLSTGQGRLLLGVYALLGIAACFPLWRSSPRPGPVSPPSGALGKLLSLLALALAGFSLFYGSSLPVHIFDPLFHFAYKGSVLYHEGFGGPGFMVPQPDQPAFERFGRVMTHPNYPPGLPMLHVLVGWALGHFDRDATRPLFALFACFPAAILYGRLRRRGALPAALAASAFLALPILYYTRTPFEYIDWEANLPEGQSEAALLSSWHFSVDLLFKNVRGFYTGAGFWPDGWTLDGAADLPVGALLAAALALATGEASGGALLASGLCLGGALLYKNEGLPLAALAVLAILAWQALAERPGLEALIRRALCLLLPLLLIALPWLRARGLVPSIDEDYPRALLGLLGLGPLPPGAGTENLIPVSLTGAWARVPAVALGFWTSFVHLLRWNLLWPLCLCAVSWWALRRPRALWRHRCMPILLWLLASLATYAVILLVTPWDLAILYKTVIPGRLLLHLAPAALLLAAELTWPFPTELTVRTDESRPQTDGH